MTSRTDFDEQVKRIEKLWLKWYDQGVKRNLPEPEEALKDILKKWAVVQPDKPHIIYNDHVLNYRDSNSLACKLANALLRLGGRKGDRISIILPNAPEIIISFMACYKTGMIAVGFNPRSTEAEIRANINDNRAVTVITAEKYAGKVINLLQAGDTSIKNVIVVDGLENDKNIDHVFDFYQLLNQEEDKEPDIEVSPADLQILYYTGGTTGISKGCCHTNKALVGHEHAFINWYSPALDEAETRILMCLPMTHGYGINCGINWCLVAGGSVIVMDTPTSDGILAAIDQYEPTVWPAVPALINQIVFHPKVKESKIGSLKVVICGSAPIAIETFANFKKLTKAKVVEGFGMSESVNAVSFNPTKNGGKLGSIGVPISDTDVLIVDIEDGATIMPPGEKGEIIYRGPQTIKEYWENPAETSHAIRDGWMYSGDIGYMDKDGFLYIVDRKKDMIIVGGFNVFPREVDELLFKHPKIYEACTIGAPEPRLGEVVKSFIVVKPGEALTAEEVILYCRENLTAYKVPKFVEFVNEIPKTKANKPDKEACRRREKELKFAEA